MAFPPPSSPSLPYFSAAHPPPPSPSSRINYCPPSPSFSQPPTPAYSLPPPSPYSNHPPPSPYNFPPPSPYSVLPTTLPPPSPQSNYHRPASPMPASPFPHQPASPYTMPPTPYSMPATPFSPFSPPPPSPSSRPPKTVANTNNLICLTTATAEINAEIHVTRNQFKDMKTNSHARPHPYQRNRPSNPPIVLRNTDIHSEPDPELQLYQYLPDLSVLTASQTEHLNRCLDVAVKEMAPQASNPSPASSLSPDFMWTQNTATSEPMSVAEPPDEHLNLAKREIVLDGYDIGLTYGRNNKFSALGVEKALQYFNNRGFSTRIFMAKSTKDEANKADKKRLNKMQSDGKLILTPSRRSDGAIWTVRDCDVEDYIVRYSVQHRAVIVSKRRFKEYDDPLLHDQVENRVLVYAFTNLDFDPPSDPLGRGGPDLATFLHFGPGDDISPGQRNVEPEKTETEAETVNKLFKRHILIDGSNIGYAFTDNVRFDVKGLEKCLQYFTDRGHDVKVYIAESMLKKREVSEQDKKKLRRLFSEHILEFTPSRQTQEQSYDCYEDDFLIRNAISKNGIIISNDNFLDLNKTLVYRDQIERRVLSYNFIAGELWLPNDPLGRGGPNLETFLHHPLVPLVPEVLEELNVYLTPSDQSSSLQPQCSSQEIPNDIQEFFTQPALEEIVLEDSDSDDAWVYSKSARPSVYIDYNQLNQ